MWGLPDGLDAERSVEGTAPRDGRSNQDKTKQSQVLPRRIEGTIETEQQNAEDETDHLVETTDVWERTGATHLKEAR